MKSIFKSISIDGNSLIPIRFLKTLKLKFDFIDINQQNDLHEILLLIINKLNEEIKVSGSLQFYNSYKLESDISDIENDYTKIETKCYKKWYELHKKEYSEIVELFYGQSISQIVCGNCLHIHHNHESFNILNLELPQHNLNDSDNGDDSSNSINIYDCLKIHTTKELINNDNDDWKCDKCNEKKTSEKIIKYWNFPPNLIICLKRFYFDKHLGIMSKNNTYIDIPFELDLKDHTLSNDSHTKYKLMSIGLHFGDIYSGHYSAVVRKNPNNDNDWLMIDDLSINTIKQKDLKAGNLAYVLFYSI